MSKDPVAAPSQAQRNQTLSLCSCDGMCVEFGDHRAPSKEWWSLTGSNRRHPACKAGALPAELRPHFLVNHNHLAMNLVGPGRLELPTSRLSGVRSNHLSYGPPDSVRIAFACGKAPDELGVSQHTKNIVQPGRNRVGQCPSLVKKEKRRRRSSAVLVGLTSQPMFYERPISAS